MAHHRHRRFPSRRCSCCSGFRVIKSLQNQSVAGRRGWLEIWNRWDSLSYQKLAEFGYSATGELAATVGFYPLYPWTVRLFAFVTRDYLVSAFIVSTVASLVAAVLLQRLVELDYSKELAQRAVWFLFIFPTSYFLHIGYTESLFLMLALGCVLAARRDRWLLAGLLGALTCLTRANGLVLVPALMVEAFQRFRTTRRWRWEWLYIALAGFGFGGYLLLNKHVTGNPFAFTSLMTQFFSKSLSPPWVGIDNAIGSLSRTPTDAEMIGVQEVLFIFLAGLHRRELDQAATGLQRVDDRKLAAVCVHEFCPQCAALHPDHVSHLHTVFDARGETSVVGGDNGLVNPVFVALRKSVCLGALGVLNASRVLSAEC